MPYAIHNVPIPERKMPPKGESKYPFKQLEIGQSFFVPNKNQMPPGEKLEDASTFANMKNHCSRQSSIVRKTPIFRCAIYKEGAQAGYWIQVWREA